MEELNSNPIYIVLFFVLRCLVPLGILLGLSYLLRRLGLIPEPAKPPEEDRDADDQDANHSEGGLAHV